ncbi:MAG: histidine triad nucleotide-binding protein [Elusimicrobiales bacterium]|nr:histidine triad nucleotide-binding protein [Elusimicrobiales bacterium]
MDCIFCKIINGEVRSNIVYEDDYVVAFNDLNPMAPTHILIVPKKHIATILDISDADADIIGKINLVAKKIAEKFKFEDFRLVANCGKDAGQSVFHIHYHFLAGRRFAWPPG